MSDFATGLFTGVFLIIAVLLGAQYVTSFKADIISACTRLTVSIR